MAPCRLSHIQVALLGHMDLKEYDLGKKESTLRSGNRSSVVFEKLCHCTWSGQSRCWTKGRVF